MAGIIFQEQFVVSKNEWVIKFKNIPVWIIQVGKHVYNMKQ